MEIKYNRSLTGVPENQQPIKRTTKTYVENAIRDPIRRNLTSLYNDPLRKPESSMGFNEDPLKLRSQFPLRKILNQDRVKRSLNADIEDKENMPQIKTKLHTLPQESRFANVHIQKFDSPNIENQNLLKHYSHDIFEHLKAGEIKSTPLEWLKNHTIPSNLRAKMVDWMVEVLSSYRCTEQTFFVAVRVMDLYFCRSEKALEVSDLHLSGVTAMFIAAKYEEIHPMKLQVVHDKIAHKKLSIDQIKRKESEILTTIGFDLVGGTVYEQTNLILTNSGLESKVQAKHYRYLKKLCLYLAKMVLYDYDICSKLNYTLMAAALLFVGFKIVEQLEPNFNAEQEIKEIATLTQLEYEPLIEAASKILSLAKNFEKQFPNLENLKKFNGFQLEDEESQ